MFSLLNPKHSNEIARIASSLGQERWGETAIHQTLSQETVFGLGAFQDKKLIGYVFGSVVCEEAEVFLIGVAQDYQRSGLGTGLMEAFMELAQEKGAEVLFLEFEALNNGLEMFYKGLGFSKIHDRQNYYRGLKPCAARVLKKNLK